METSIWLGVGTLLLLILPCHEEYRGWTNTEGVRIDAQLVKAEGENVTLRMRNGKVSTFPQAKLSQEDREFIKANASEAKPAGPSTAAPKIDASCKAKWLIRMDKAKKGSCGNRFAGSRAVYGNDLVSVLREAWEKGL